MADFDDTSLKALVANEIDASERYADDDLSADRVRALDYFNGKMPDTPQQTGRSGFISRDVSDVIGWILPGIMRVFTASNRIVDFEPGSEADEEFADQASDYINHVFWKQNCGYQIMWDAEHDALLQKDGIVKQYWDTSEECHYSIHHNLTEDSLALLMQEDGVEVVAQSEGDPAPMETPEGIIEVPTFNVKIKRTTTMGRLVYETVEPENFLINRSAITIEGSRFVAHRNPDITRSDLIEMGFDRDVIDNLPRYNAADNTSEKMARDGDNSFTDYDVSDPSMDRIDLYECYLKADVDDDGIAEMVRVYYAGAGGAGEVLDWEVWEDETPFDKIPCTPVPHRWSSDSLADETMDVQQFKTVIGRQFFDNTYAVNLPTPDIEEGSILNMDALVNPGLGVPLIRKKNTPPINWNVVPYIGDKALMGMEYLDRVTEMRTGVSRATMSLDPETLQNQTATANQNQRDAAYSQIELIARNQAELGWKKVFQKSLRIIVKNQDRPTTIRLRDKWVDMDPRYWNASMDASINVGLGTGSRDRDMTMLNSIAQSQVGLADRLAGTGFTEKSVEMLPMIVKTFTRIAEASGIKNPEAYYPQIDEDDIEAMKAQMAEQQAQGDPKAAAEAQKAEADMQIKQQELQFKAMQGEQEMQLKRYQIDQEMALKREQLAAELQLKREQMAAELQLKREAGFVDAYNKTNTSLSSTVHMGGDPG